MKHFIHKLFAMVLCALLMVSLSTVGVSADTYGVSSFFYLQNNLGNANSGDIIQVNGDIEIPESENIAVKSDVTLKILDGYSLTIENGATLTVESGGTLTVDGELNLKGTLTGTSSAYGLANGSGAIYQYPGFSVSYMTFADIQITHVWKPAAPTDLAATAGAGQVTLQWTVKEADGNKPITGYVIKVDDEEQDPTMESPVVITGLTPGQTYSFVVYAINDAGDGAESSPVTAVPLPQPVGPVEPPIVEPVRPTTPSRNSDDDDDDSGSSGASSDSVIASSNTSANVGLGGAVSAAEIASDTSAALKGASGDSAIVRTRNASSISPEVLASLAKEAATAGKALTLHADTVVDNVVQGRLYVDPAALSNVTEDIQLGVYTSVAQTASIAQRFETHFDNMIQVVKLEQQGSFGARLQISAKIDLTGLNTENLYFYSYDAQTNTYKRIDNTAHWVDSNGYLHFYTQLAGSIIITDGPLTPNK